jgi:hypothetical protein
VAGSQGSAGSRFFRGQILIFARFLDFDVPDRIGCWRGIFDVGEAGRKEKGFLLNGIENLHVFLGLGLFGIAPRVGFWITVYMYMLPIS